MSSYSQRLVSDINYAEEAELRRIERGIGFSESPPRRSASPFDGVELPDEDEYEESAPTAASVLQSASPAYKEGRPHACTATDEDSPLSFCFEDEASPRGASPASPALSLPSEEWDASPREPPSPEHPFACAADAQASDHAGSDMRAVDWPLMGRRLPVDDDTSGSPAHARTAAERRAPAAAAALASESASESTSLYRERICVEPLSGIALAARGVAPEKLQCRLEESRASLFKLHDAAAHAFGRAGPLATIGVIVKIENRTNSRGEECAQWSVSDLHPWTPSTLQLWLQGEAYRHAGKQGSRFTVGKVVALLGPKVLHVARLSDSVRGLTCSVNKAAQLLAVGDAAELARCPYKLGNHCCDVLIHRKKAEYCPGHMLSATSAPSTSRLDITGARPPPPRNAGRGNFRPGLSSQPFRNPAGASRPGLGRGGAAAARGGTSEGGAAESTASTKRTAQEELRKEFSKRRTSVGARNIVQQICAAQELEAQEREKERRRKALGPLPSAANRAAAKAPTKPAEPAAPAPEQLMCLDEEGELVSLEEASSGDQNAKDRRFTWQEVMPLPAVPLGRHQETSADAVSSIFGDVATIEEGNELLRQVRDVADRNARLTAASMM